MTLNQWLYSRLELVTIEQTGRFYINKSTGNDY